MAMKNVLRCGIAPDVATFASSQARNVDDISSDVEIDRGEHKSVVTLVSTASSRDKRHVGSMLRVVK